LLTTHPPPPTLFWRKSLNFNFFGFLAKNGKGTVFLAKNGKGTLNNHWWRTLVYCLLLFLMLLHFYLCVVFIYLLVYFVFMCVTPSLNVNVCCIFVFVCVYCCIFHLFVCTVVLCYNLLLYVVVYVLHFVRLCVLLHFCICLCVLLHFFINKFCICLCGLSWCVLGKCVPRFVHVVSWCRPPRAREC
jgi:hypothetical protein